jgi:hypothetical protein
LYNTKNIKEGDTLYIEAVATGYEMYGTVEVRIVGSEKREAFQKKLTIFTDSVKEVVKSVPQVGDTVVRTDEYLKANSSSVLDKARGTVISRSKNWLVVVFYDKPCVDDISTFEVVK